MIQELYDLRDLRSKCNMDVMQIGHLGTKSLDQYLFNFPLQKQLAYAYLKNVGSTPVKISYLHSLFKEFDRVIYFKSKEHKQRMKDDEIYKKIVNRYVRNPWTWVTSMQPMQPYFFDSKYLKIGQFQKIAKRCADTYFNVQLMHYTIPYSKIKTKDHMSNHNEWWIERQKIEKSYFNNLLKPLRISTKLRYKWFHRYLEFYDTVSTLTLQFEISQFEVKMHIIWPRGSKKRSRKESQYQIMKLIQRYQELFALYQKLSNDRMERCTYLDATKSVDEKFPETFKMLKGTMVHFLEDIHNQNGSAYINDQEVQCYLVHQGSVESCVLAARRGKIRLYRTIKLLNDPLERTDTIDLCSYLIPEKDIESQAAELLYIGMLNIGDKRELHTMYDYELLATGKSKEFALQYFKLPSIDAMKFFSDYEEQLELLKVEIQYYEENDLQVEDTRDFSSEKLDYPLTTYFEWDKFNTDPVRFDRDREKFSIEKDNRIKDFVKKNKHTLDKLSESLLDIPVD